MGLGGGDLLTGSAFAMKRETRHGGILSFWSRGAQSHFSGREGALSLGGDVRTTMFGADYAKGPLVAGLSLSHSRGLGEYAGVAGGQVASSVTGLYSWLGYKATDRITVWGVAGYGAGGLLLTPQGGPAGRLAATDAAVTRFRTGLEGSRAYTLAGRVSLTPSIEMGLRHDGGDAETGAGMDVGGGLIVSDASTGLAVEVRVRTLLVHKGRGVPGAGRGRVAELQPDAVDAAGLCGAGWRRRGAGRRRAGPRRCGAGRRWRAWRTAASRRATGSTARSATGCRWGAGSWGRRGSASARRSTAGTTGSATAWVRSTGRA